LIDWDPPTDTYECAKMVYTEEEVEVEMVSVPSNELTK